MSEARMTGLDAELDLTIEEAQVGGLKNNLTTAEEGFALDARQGRALDEKKLDRVRMEQMRVSVEEDTETAVAFQGGESGYQMTFRLRRAATTFSGTAVTGKDTAGRAYPTGIAAAVAGDRYFYNGTDEADVGSVYRCVLGGDEATALWAYDGNIRGIAGEGSVSFVNGRAPDGEGNAVITGAEIAQSEGSGTTVAEALEARLKKSEVYDGLDQEEAGYALDARQGKALTEALDEARTSLGQRIEGKASTARYGATLKAGGWSAGAPYEQTVAVSGVLATDDPFVDVDMSGAGSASAGTELTEAWMLVGRVKANEGSVTAYCYEDRPAVDIPLILKVVR